VVKLGHGKPWSREKTLTFIAGLRKQLRAPAPAPDRALMLADIDGAEAYLTYLDVLGGNNVM
jgi:hypothetical protein